jgi:hypothetical protein
MMSNGLFFKKQIRIATLDHKSIKLTAAHFPLSYTHPAMPGSTGQSRDSARSLTLGITVLGITVPNYGRITVPVELRCELRCQFRITGITVPVY